ncbi:hypothetical protein WKI65_37380 [Streptomyces sp. MS1.AVA.3]|uniref:hypothetical protein n=1 Tax=Streptomyces decoyicus TaxID=249567 RepID=UPI0030C4BB26
MIPEPVSPWVGARPARWRLWGGAAGIGAVVVLTVVALGSASPTLFRCSAVLSALLLLGSYWVVKPWFVARSETWHRVITFVPMTGYVATLGLVVVAAASFLPDQPVVAGLALVMIWCFHVGGGVREPTSFAYERLRGRLTWTAALQVAAMCCGTVGVVCLIRDLPVPGRYAPAVFATCLSVVVGLVVASSKVFARVRKLATELDDRAQRMERCLDRLSRGAVADRCQLRDTAEDAWDALNRTLRNKVETGFHQYGTFVIPSETRKALEALVTEAITNPGAPSCRDAIAQLTMLRTACRAKIDTLA